MNIWRLITYHEYPGARVQWARERKRIAIGWGKIGDLRSKPYSSPKDIAHAIQQVYPNLQNSGDGGASLWRFFHEMKGDDLVILSTGTGREAVMKVRGEYEWVAAREAPLYATYHEGADYQHQRAATEIQICPDELWRRAGGRARGENPRGTLIKCSISVDRLNAYV